MKRAPAKSQTHILKCTAAGGGIQKKVAHNTDVLYERYMNKLVVHLNNLLGFVFLGCWKNKVQKNK